VHVISDQLGTHAIIATFIRDKLINVNTVIRGCKFVVESDYNTEIPCSPGDYHTEMSCR